MYFDIKFHDFQGKNYKWAIPKLHKEIVPEKCKFKEDKANMDEERDPMAGIMDLMKVRLPSFENMYNEGDADMKTTIAKA
ncbi:unnamed protein product [Prunus armeniaca]|uniref:Uncharacterized protein n=1 Tax=Prunus armeniaca TaxID=36596 RepID=A0A6J5UK34_PRUAR|nr:unnamed protein product [Prunus armeniaca]CAB4306844.1 unnamed protein product [Prunus armeniaca]